MASKVKLFTVSKDSLGTTIGLVGKAANAVDKWADEAEHVAAMAAREWGFEASIEHEEEMAKLKQRLAKLPAAQQKAIKERYGLK